MEAPDLDILLVQLKDGRESVRLMAAKALGQNPQKLAQIPLLGALQDTSAQVRYSAILALEPLLESPHQKEILNLFQDSSRLVRLGAGRLVGKTPSRIAFGPLLEMLGDPDGDVRSLASFSLSRYAEKYVPRILDELVSSHWLRRFHVYQTMILMGKRSHSAIHKALREKSLPREKRYWLIKLVGEFRLKPELEILLASLETLKNTEDVELLEVHLESLGKLGSHPAIRPMLQFLDHPIERIREACIEALSLQGEHAVTLLLAKLDDDSRPIRVSSARSLAKIGDLSVAPLLDSFYQKDKEGRFWILQALRNLNVSVVRTIFQSLCYDEDPDLQVLSIASLAQYSWDEETLSILIDLLDHELWRVRNEASNTLSRLEGIEDTFFINGLLEGSSNRKYWMIRIMERRNSEAFLDPLIKTLLTEDWVLKTAACEALRSFQNHDLSPLLQVFEEGDENAVYWITRAFIGSRDPSVISAMKSCLDSQHVGVRQNALTFFQQLGSSSASYLRVIYSERHSRRVYSQVTDLLAEMMECRQEVMLDLLASSQKEEVYWGSILAGKVGKEALVKVHELLESSDWKLRSNGLLAVEQIGSVESRSFVMELLEDEYFSIRKMAVTCLGTIGDTTSESVLIPLALSEDVELSIRVLATLAKLNSQGKETRELFLGALKNENWLVQKEALKGISVLKNEEFIGPLLEYGKAVPQDLIEEYLDAAGAFGNPDFQSLLLKYLESPDPRILRKTLHAIGQISQFSEPMHIVEFLNHDDWEIQKEAVDALGRLRAKEAIPALKGLLEDSDPVLKHHIKSCLREILGKEVWKKLLEEFVQSSRHEQAQSFFKEAREEVSKQHWNAALSLLNKSVALHESAPALHLMARSHAELKQFEQAERCCLKILQLKPGNLKVLSNLSMIYFLQGQKDRVEEIFTKIESSQEIPDEVSEMILRTREKMCEPGFTDK